MRIKGQKVNWRWGIDYIHANETFHYMTVIMVMNLTRKVKRVRLCFFHPSYNIRLRMVAATKTIPIKYLNSFLKRNKGNSSEVVMVVYHVFQPSKSFIHTEMHITMFSIRYYNVLIAFIRIV